MRLCTCLFSFIFSCAAEAKTLYIVQSSNVTDLYKNALIGELRKELTSSEMDKDVRITVLFMRNYRYDTYESSKEFTSMEVMRRAQDYDNLLIIGEDAAFLQDYEKEPRSKLTPILSEYAGVRAPNAPAHQLEVIENLYQKTSQIEPVVHVITDSSVSSRNRLKQFTEYYATQESRLSMRVYEINTLVELRATIFKLNSQPRAFLVNNAFNVLAKDSNEDISIAGTDVIINSKNTRHVVIGGLYPDSVSAIRVGASLEEMTHYILNTLYNTCSEIETEVIFNTDVINNLNLSTIFSAYTQKDKTEAQ